MIIGLLRKREAEEVGVVDSGAFMLVESPGCFTAFAGSEVEFLATFVAGPGEHGVPELTADALTATRFVGDKIF